MTTIEEVTARLDRAGIPYERNRRWGPDDLRLLDVDDRVHIILYPSREQDFAVAISARPAKKRVRNSTIDRVRMDVADAMLDAGLSVSRSTNWNYGSAQ